MEKKAEVSKKIVAQVIIEKIQDEKNPREIKTNIIQGYDNPEKIVIKDKKEGTVQRTITDDTLPGGPRERVITYYAPFDKCDREKDYALAWESFS